jgi:uncharacterized membrane protein YkoI
MAAKKKTGSKKGSTKLSAAKKKTGSRKSPAKKTAAKKRAGTKKTAAKKKTGTKKKASKRYGAAAQNKVGSAVHALKRGGLKSGRSGRSVKSRKQAIAIGLSEARAAGGKVPPAPGAKRAKKRAKKR